MDTAKVCDVSETKKKSPGRPRKFETDNDRMKAFRRRKNKELYRIDIYVSYSANNRIEALSKAWGCSKGEVVNRLVLEADQRYEDILFPENKNI